MAMTNLLDLAAARAALPDPRTCKAIRESADVSQADLAAELGTSAMTISRWESGRRAPSKRFVAAYVDLLRKLDRLNSGRLAAGSGGPA